jgi:Ni/Fe-hydrogenase 1 B-type cytochrome subunit
MTHKVRRVFVWPSVIRIVHWCLALAVTVLLCTGWLLKSGLILNDKLYILLLDQLHLPAGHLLGLAMVVRIFYLLKDDGVSGVSSLLSSAKTWDRIKEGLRFYTTFTKTSLPRYFAHHPVWAPLYLVIFVLLLAQLVSGSLLEFATLRALFGLSSDALLDWHQAPFSWLSMLVILHLVSVSLHEIKGEGADVSGMINGYRNFNVNSDVNRSTGSTVPSVSLNSIGGMKSKNKSD